MSSNTDHADMESVGDWKMDQRLRGKRKGKSAYVNNLYRIEKTKYVLLYPPKGQVIEIVCA